MVGYRVPHNAVVQMYDFQKKTSRVVCGPDYATLNPNEEFTLLNLSAGRPKAAKVRKVSEISMKIG